MQKTSLALITTASLLLGSFTAQATMLSGFGGDAGYGELAMGRNDDGSSNQLDLPFEINYFGNSYNEFFVNNNGNITFESPLDGFTPVAFPVAEQPMIAPFWADVDTGCAECGEVYVGSPSDGVVAVTWDNVGYYDENSNKANSFQAVLIDRSDTGAGNFDVEFRYDKLEWTTGDASNGSNGLGGTPAQAGYDAGDGENFFALPGSFSENILDLVSSSNTGEDGVWRFAIREGALPGATPDNPIMPVVVDGGWGFEFNVDADELVFIDPDVAVGYDYIVDSGPNIRTVTLPAGFDDDMFFIWLWTGVDWEQVANLAAGDVYDFGVDGVDRFRVTGIDTSNELDPNDELAFVTGLTFAGSGTVAMRQLPILEFIPGPGNAVPEPSTWLLMLVAVVLLLSSRKRSDSAPISLMPA
ncbi:MULTISPECIES: nidogen-like domain-containing protein [unclassified Agarivorans]|uniref:nidogen-like domain-containing protein n=1 Tax=unclassified Agarivorans TaxID=2636026 RepID=UPI0026E3ADF9|nr:MULTISPECIES: nidogen-like domain-containing protein [unclassified Agarivorans]MDO6687217.1 nidogen-like domain-containing protein [Agarivorans sp. 3_MG-2023]MDO6716856.1 nidogen-like domain-containing protein [Agarivorans sp. 2_MG-2023]